MNPTLQSNSVGIGLGMVLCLTPAFAVAQPAPASEPAAQASAAVPNPADPFMVHLQNARAQFERDQYQSALSEYQAAYALRQHPLLLLEMARTHQRLGNQREAVTLYRRYLTASDDPRDVHRAEAERAVERLQMLLPEGTTAPRPALSPTAELPYRVITRPHHRGMVAAGWTLFSIGYAAAFGTGIGMGIAWNSTNCYPNSYYCTSYPSSAAGWTLLIPIAGPLISGIIAPVTSHSSSYALAWTLPWLLADLPFQVIGLALLWKGYKTPQKLIVPSFVQNVQIKPYSHQTGAGLTMTGSF